MNSEQFLNWIISNPEYAGLAMFIIGFLESFFISGAIWPSVILLLFAVGLSESDIKLAFICIGAGLGSWVGDTLSFYSGLLFWTEIEETQFFTKKTSSL